MAEMQPSASPDDRGHDDPQSVPGDPAIIRPRGFEVQPPFHPLADRLGLEDVRAYQVHLVSKGISWASLDQVVCALRFFYGVYARLRRDPRTDRLCPRAAQAAGCAQRR